MRCLIGERYSYTNPAFAFLPAFCRTDLSPNVGLHDEHAPHDGVKRAFPPSVSCFEMFTLGVSNGGTGRRFSLQLLFAFRFWGYQSHGRCMVASDSPGTSRALAFADARMRFIWVNQRGFGRD